MYGILKNVIASYRDFGLNVNRENHEYELGRILSNDKELKKYFNNEKVQIMKEAVEDHRGSKKERPRNINCEKPIYINFLKAIANTEFLILRFLHLKKYNKELRKMNLYVVRHGQTDWNLIKKLQGQKDIELNETGKQQAKVTSDLIKNEKIDLIITSPLKRASETAKIINRRFDVPIIEDKRLMERNFGEYEGTTKNERKQMKEIHPEINDVWNYNRNINFNDLETMKAFCNRIYEFLNEITKKYRDKNILIVTHGGTSMVIKCYFMKYPLEKLVDRDAVKGLENCEIMSFNI